MTEEIWLPVPGYESIYEVSNLGRVKSLWRRLRSGRSVSPRILTPAPNSSGRMLVILYDQGRNRCCFVYQLVIEAFIGPRPGGMVVNHKDGDPTNDHLENLEYTTPKGNIRHAAEELGTMAHGERHWCAKLTRTKVKEIRALWAERKYQQRELADMYGVTQRAIWQVIHRHTWKHVP